MGRGEGVLRFGVEGWKAGASSDCVLRCWGVFEPSLDNVWPLIPLTDTSRVDSGPEVCRWLVPADVLPRFRRRILPVFDIQLVGELKCDEIERRRLLDGVPPDISPGFSTEASGVCCSVSTEF